MLAYGVYHAFNSNEIILYSSVHRWSVKLMTVKNISGMHIK